MITIPRTIVIIWFQFLIAGAASGANKFRCEFFTFSRWLFFFHLLAIFRCPSATPHQKLYKNEKSAIILNPSPNPRNRKNPGHQGDPRLPRINPSNCWFLKYFVSFIISSFSRPASKYIASTNDPNRGYNPEWHQLSQRVKQATYICAYDMDEMDDCWLRIFNESRAKLGWFFFSVFFMLYIQWLP
jgi:hypothetical protein